MATADNEQYFHRVGGCKLLLISVMQSHDLTDHI